MNWGNKLLLVFVAFGSLMGFMVYKCMQSPISLVSAEYYKDELNYQQVIDGTARSNELLEQVKLTQYADYIQLQLPPEMKEHTTQGSVWFYNVSDGKKDKHMKLSANEEGIQQFALNEFDAGRYIVKIEWNTAETNYYTEKEIIIQ